MAKKKELEEEFEEEFEEPQDDDYVIVQPNVMSHKHCVMRFGFGEQIACSEDIEKLERIIKQDMKKKDFYPNVWDEEERGGYSHHNFTERKKKAQTKRNR